MNIADLLLRYIKLDFESYLGIIGAAASATVCLVASSTRPMEGSASVYQLTVFSLAFLIVATSLSLCMMAELLLKRQEISILRALGAGKRIVIAVFLSKSILIGTLGSVVGIALGCVFTVTTHLIGQPYYSEELILRTLMLVFLGSMTGGLHVAIRASRMNIVEAIRG